MNLFGLVLGQHVLMVIIAALLIYLALGMLKGGWFGRIAGILLFAGSVGWLSSIILYDNARIPGLALPAPYVLGLLAACYAAFLVYQKRDSEKKAFFASRSINVNKNSVIAGTVLGVVVIVTLSILGQANWESFFDFDNGAANRAREQASNGVLRFINRFLRDFDRFLAR